MLSNEFSHHSKPMLLTFKGTYTKVDSSDFLCRDILESPGIPVLVLGT